VQFTGRNCQRNRVGRDDAAETLGQNFDLEQGISHGDFDLAGFGRAFLANPDLPKRFAAGASLNEVDRATMYGGGAKGYVDYPFLDAAPSGAGAPPAALEVVAAPAS